MAPSTPLTRFPRLAGRLTDRGKAVAAVAAGGLIGSTARTGVGAWVSTPSEGFPTEVVLVNLAGSLLLGFYLARRERSVTGRWSLHFWGIGVLGSFTTFCTFSVDLVQLVAADRLATAAGYLVASVVGGLMCVLMGQRIGGAIA